MTAVDEAAFLPGTPEVELEEHKDVLTGQGWPKMGRALLTNDRIVFVDQRFNEGAAMASGGILAGVVARKLQKRHEAKGAALDVPLASITRVARGQKRSNKKILVLELDGGERRLNEAFERWEPLLRRLLVERHAGNLVEDGEDAWRVTR